MQQITEGFSLSPQQTRLWSFNQQCETHRAYLSLMMEGPLDIATLRRALEAIFFRHEIFRTTFCRLPGMLFPVQVINDRPLYSWQQISLDSDSVQRDMLDELLLEAQTSPLDIEKGLLLHCLLLTLGEQKHLLHISTSPLHADMHTLSLLIGEVFSLYQSYSEAGRDQDQDIAQYVQFSEWQNSLLEEEESRAYWSGKNIELSPTLSLPYERKREMPDNYHSLSVSVSIEADIKRNIDTFLEQQQCSLPVFLFACWQVLLWRFLNRSDLLFGLGMTGRIYDDLKDIAGPTARYIPFICHAHKQQRFCDFLAQVKEEYTEHLAQQLYFAPQLADTVTATPRYPFGFDYYTALPGMTTRNVSFTPQRCYVSSEPFKIRFIVQESADAPPTLTLEYHADLYARQDIQRLSEQMLLLLQDGVQRPECALDDLNMLGAAERELVLLTYNQKSSPYPQEMCLHQLFERQVEQTPDAIAVIDEEHHLTYHALDVLSHRLAHHLQTLTIGPEDLVGLYLERSATSVVAILGVLKAGAAYVPLDITAPLSHLSFIATDANLKLTLTSQQLLVRLTEWPDPTPIVPLESVWKQLAGKQDLPELVNAVSASNLAYVIYTSGSTGKPKGAMIPHRGVVHYVYWSSQHYEVAAGRGIPVHSPITFDLTVTALFAPLAVGRPVWLLRETRDISELITAIQQIGQWSLLKLTPSHLNLINQLLEPADLAESSRALILGGEALKGESVRLWQQKVPQTRIINEYGPTETVVGCCIYEVALDEEVGDQIPIGQPIPNTRCYVLDEHGQPVPIGITGELYIGGVGLGRGYASRADLTAERFVPDPYCGVAGARMYRTGDLGRYKNQQGILEYLGRIDRQVKVRGYRIELGEIEAVLEQHEGVRECAVEVYEAPALEKILVAYIVPGKGATLDQALLRGYLSNQLPAYMVLENYIFLDALPLTANGKINRALLPLPDSSMRSSREAFRDINAVVPRDILEFQLLQIWEETLRKRPILIDDSFFALGGHSILAVSLMAQIRKRLGIDLPLATLFEHKTIAELAVVVRQRMSAVGIQAVQDAQDAQTLIAIQPGGTKLPFFSIHPAGGTVFCYINLAHHLGPDQPFYGLQIPDSIGRGADEIRLEDLAASYIVEIQKVQPQGPYLLGGWSSGGVMAFEIAQQLRRCNQEVALLALLDTMIPFAHLHPEPHVEALDTSDAAMVREIVIRKNFSVREDILSLSPEEQLRSVMEEGKKANFVPDDIDLEQFRRLRRIHLMNLYALKIYKPEMYSGKIDVFRAVESIKPEEQQVEGLANLPISWSSTGGWETLTTQDIVVHAISGTHKEMMSEPNVQLVATVLKDRLEQVILPAR